MSGGGIQGRVSGGGDSLALGAGGQLLEHHVDSLLSPLHHLLDSDPWHESGLEDVRREEVRAGQ